MLSSEDHKHNYTLTIRVPLDARDDVEARKLARGLVELHKPPKTSVLKLQRLQEGKEPQGVRL